MPTTVTSTIAPSGGDYTTITAWEAAKQGDLVSADQIQVGQLSGFTSGLNERLIDIDGSTTDATRYIELKLATPHAGVWQDANMIYYDDVGGSNYILKNNDQYVRLTGLLFRMGYGGATNGESACLVAGDGIAAGGSDIRAIGCIAKKLSTSAGSGSLYGLTVTDVHATVAIVNCLSYDWTQGSGIGIYIITAATASLYNNTTAANDVGVQRDAGTVVVKNHLAQDTDGYNGTFSASSDNNLSEIAADCPGTNADDSITVTFANEGSDDYHLNDTQAALTGADLSADGTFAFSTDIDGDTRTAWRKGIDDGASAAAQPIGALAGQIGGAGLPRLAGFRGGLAGFVKVGNIYRPKRWLWLPPGLAPQGA